MALSGAKQRVWNKIQEDTNINARFLEIIELLEAQRKWVIGFNVMDGLIYYKDYVCVQNVSNLKSEILAHFPNHKEGGQSGWL